MNADYIMFIISSKITELFSCYRSLRNNRTRIHKNLFIAMVIQVIIRLTLYLDQALIRRGQESGNDSVAGIDNTVSLNKLLMHA